MGLGENWANRPQDPSLRPRAVMHLRNGNDVVTLRAVSEESEGRRPTDNFLAHYGVEGQKWGVITKEYQPVAVDHRKTRGGFSIIRNRNQRQMSQRTQTGKNQELSPMERRAIQRERRQRHWKYASYAIIGMASLLALYGAHKYVSVNKAKAYTGMLNRFLEQNKGVDFRTPSGSKILQEGMKRARKATRHFNDALEVNKYLKGRGMKVGKKAATRVYSARRAMERYSKVAVKNTGSFADNVRKYRKTRMLSRVLDKLYF